MAVALAIMAACTRVSTPPPPANVLIVTLDTARADRLSAYGFQGVAMPAIDRLASEGIVFQEAITVAPLTLPAHCSLLTGLYPLHHGVRDNADRPLQAAHLTLAEILRPRGFQTAAFVGASVLGADRGLARGFDVYQDATPNAPDAPRPIRRRGDEVVGEALRWLSDHSDSPFFLWVHLYDAHAPYRPPEPYRTQYSTDPYEGSLAFLDSQVDRLLRSLESDEQFGRTLIVLAGDHGESLGDHRELEHGIFLYDSVLHVPLIMRGPDIAPRRFAAATSLVDVMPTVLGLLGIPAPHTDGVDLTSEIRRSLEPANRLIYSESLYPERFGWSALRSVRDGHFKFIEAPRPELYDLETDPFEERNLFASQLATAGTLSRRLDAFNEDQRSPGRPNTRVAHDVTARLEALGYIGTDARSVSRSQRDPKDYIGAYNAMRRARSLQSP